MARCVGTDPPYGCGHHAEHVRAAKLGWLRRRSAATFKRERDVSFFERATGGRIRHAHRHPEHPQTVVFKRGNKWYEMPQTHWRAIVTAGREEARAERRGEQRAQAEERAVRAVRRAEYQDINRMIQSLGGIKVTRQQGFSNRGEIETLPSQLRARKGRGLSLDRMRESVNEDMPWLNLETEQDLLDVIERHRTTKMHRG